MNEAPNQYVIIYHNEHLFDGRASGEVVIGPFPKGQAIIQLTLLCDALNRDRDPESGLFAIQEQDYMGLEEEFDGCDLAYEVWAEIVPIIPAIPGPVLEAT